MFPGTLSETANSASLGKKTSNKLHPDTPSLHQLYIHNMTLQDFNSAPAALCYTFQTSDK